MLWKRYGLGRHEGLQRRRGQLLAELSVMRRRDRVWDVRRIVFILPEMLRWLRASVRVHDC